MTGGHESPLSSRLSAAKKAAFAAHYRNNNINLPDVLAELASRMLFGNKVVDHEVPLGQPGTPGHMTAI